MDKPVSYLQTDSKWANIDYSAKGEKTTIGKSGCGPSCMAMVIATWKDKSVTPKESCAWSLSHGYKAVNQGTYYSFFSPYGRAYDLEVSQLNGANIRGLSSAKAKAYHDQAVEALKAGDLVIACMGEGLWTSDGHFILPYGVDGSTVYINDPNSTASNKIIAKLSQLQAEVKYYFHCKKPVTIQSHSANYYAVQKKYNFDSNTMGYLEAYQYADSLFAIMLLDINNRKFQVNTINYILAYKYGVEVFKRINEIA